MKRYNFEDIDIPIIVMLIGQAFQTMHITRDCSTYVLSALLLTAICVLKSILIDKTFKVNHLLYLCYILFVLIVFGTKPYLPINTYNIVLGFLLLFSIFGWILTDNAPNFYKDLDKTAKAYIKACRYLIITQVIAILGIIFDNCLFL